MGPMGGGEQPWSSEKPSVERWAPIGDRGVEKVQRRGVKESGGED
jgi:hypothetical protein